jgi:hypothetical protein
MQEVAEVEHRCVDCGTEVLREGDRSAWPERCPVHKDQRNREMERAAQKRRPRPSRAKPSKTVVEPCVACGTDVTIARKTRWEVRCTSCAEDRAVQKRRALASGDPQEHRCLECGVELQRKGARGAWPLRCPTHREEHDAQRRRTAEVVRPKVSRARTEEPEPRRCLNCPAPVYWRFTRWQLRCDSCAEVQAREVRASRRSRLIVQRRKWLRALTCEQCGEPVSRGNRRLRIRLCLACLKTYRNAQVTAYRISRPEASREASRRWQRRNPDAVRSRNSLRRARRRSVTFERFRHEEIFNRDGWRCQICRRPVDRNAPRFHPRSPTLDHVIPLSQGGPHTKANTRCACWSCNASRGNRGGNEQLALI